MRITNFIVILFLILFSIVAFSQSSYLPIGSREYILLDRLEIKSNNTNLNFSTVKPFSRRIAVEEAQIIDSAYYADGTIRKSISKIDKYNIERFLASNREWTSYRGRFISKRPVLKEFYKTKGNFFEVDTTDFFLSINPLIQYQQSLERNNSQNLFYNSRGVAVRGLISNKIGFDFYITDNQERDPLYVQEWIRRNIAIPSAGFLKTFKTTGVDYFDMRGSVFLNIGKRIEVQLGYDKNFIGSGFRSLFLSDFSHNAMFLKLNGHFGKLNYENLFLQLIPDHIGQYAYPRKYLQINYFNYQLARWLNVGLFEAVMFGQKDNFNAAQLLPLPFLHKQSSDRNNPNNLSAGLDLKANLLKRVQVYGQCLIDKFSIKQFKSDPTWWGNQFGYQIGAKYIDAFGINNLDLLIESNSVRPFTYSHFNAVSNYTHYNKPLAHPLGANFQECVFIAKYQPVKKIFFEAKIINFKQGLDTATLNHGSNIFKDQRTRTRDYGFETTSGNAATCSNVSFLTSYELKDHLFIDANTQIRNYSTLNSLPSNSVIFSIGVRWNMVRRNFDF